MAEKPYMVFTNDPELEAMRAAGDGGAKVAMIGPDWWEAHGPIMASGPMRAIEKLWEMDPTLKVRPEIRYLPIANFDPIQNEKELIEKWTLKRASESEPAQQELA